MGEIKRDLDRFFRNMKLRLFFSEDPELDLSVTPTQQNTTQPTQTDDGKELSLSEKLERLFRKKSTWSPKSQDVTLEAFIRAVTNDFYEMQPRKVRNRNLTKPEFHAISTLKNNTQIVIKKADKGSAIVVMNKSDYITEATRQLADGKFYIKTPNQISDSKRYSFYLRIIHNRKKSEGKISLTKISGSKLKYWDENSQRFDSKQKYLMDYNILLNE